MKKIVLMLIKGYQNTSFLHANVLKILFLTDASCRFSPTCSQYTYEAVNKYGVIKGLFIGLKRISRCHPWARGGYDPLP
jgi:putative membrane protein insertion efficiency factor